MRLEERYNKVLAWFRERMPLADTELQYKDPFQLLVAVILSAQCTDKRVNMVTPALFERFPDAASMSRASVEEIFELIKSISYPNVMEAVAFKRPAMPVDTHVFRVADRIGLVTGAKTPLETEKQLVAHIPAEWLSSAHHWLILHGRYVCMARKPKCEECGIAEWCRYNQKKLS